MHFDFRRRCRGYPLCTATALWLIVGLKTLTIPPRKESTHNSESGWRLREPAVDPTKKLTLLINPQRQLPFNKWTSHGRTFWPNGHLDLIHCFLRMLNSLSKIWWTFKHCAFVFFVQFLWFHCCNLTYCAWLQYTEIKTPVELFIMTMACRNVRWSATGFQRV